MMPGERYAYASSLLEAAADRDWSVVAGELTWTCRETAEHIANALLSYAGQLICEPVSGWLPFDIAVKEAATLASQDRVELAERLLREGAFPASARVGDSHDWDDSDATYGAGERARSHALKPGEPVHPPPPGGFWSRRASSVA